MRRGRALLPHPTARQDDTGRWLASRQIVAHLADRDVDHVRRLVPPVAYDVSAHHRHDPSPCCSKCQRTATALLDLEEAEKVLGGRPFAEWKRRRPLQV